MSLHHYELIIKESLYSIQINMSNEEEPYLRALCEKTGLGSVHNHENGCRWTINSREGLRTLITLINGRLRSHKVSKLSELINWYDSYDNIYSTAALRRVDKFTELRESLVKIKRKMIMEIPYLKILLMIDRDQI